MRKVPPEMAFRASISVIQAPSTTMPIVISRAAETKTPERHSRCASKCTSAALPGRRLELAE
jgi:hypothetical protein